MEEEPEQSKPLPYQSEDTLTYLEQYQGLQDGIRSVWF